MNPVGLEVQNYLVELEISSIVISLAFGNDYSLVDPGLVQEKLSRKPARLKAAIGRTYLCGRASYVKAFSFRLDPLLLVFFSFTGFDEGGWDRIIVSDCLEE